MKKCKPNFFFDYIYFRSAELYYKWEGKNPSTAIVFLTMIQFLIFGTLIVLIFRLFFNPFQLELYSKYVKMIGLPIGIGLIIWNYYRYYDKYEDLREYWKNEQPLQKRIKSTFIALLIIIPIAILITLGNISTN